MSEFNKYSTDGGATFIDVEDSNAVHWGDQSKGYVGKNLIQNTANSQTKNGVTFTVNDDKSVSLSGTSTGNTFVTLYSLMGSVIKSWGNTLILSGGSQNAYFNIHKSDFSYNKQSWGEDKAIDTTVLEDNTEYKFSIGIDGVKNVNSMVIKPMLRFASISDSTYEPYLTPNTEIPEKLSYVDNRMLGAKNLLSTPYNSSIGNHTRGGVTILFANDGSISFNGTSTGGAQSFDIHRRVANNDSSDLYLAPGDYIYSVDSNLEDSNSEIHVGSTKNGSYLLFNQTTYGHELRFTVPSDFTGFDYTRDGKLLVAVYIGWTKGNVTYNNKKFKLMIRLASDSDDTYAPYAMTNKELTANVLNTFYVKKTLTNADDLDDYTETGVYFIGGSAPTNAPEGKVNCILEVINCDNDSLILQRYTRPHDGFIYTRFKNPSNWFNWHKFTSTELT